MELLEEPYKIYSRGTIAVPLRGYEDYREIGLKRLLCMLGAEKVSKGLCSRVSKSFHSSVIARVQILTLLVEGLIWRMFVISPL